MEFDELDVKDKAATFDESEVFRVKFQPLYPGLKGPFKHYAHLYAWTSCKVFRLNYKVSCMQI